MSTTPAPTCVALFGTSADPPTVGHLGVLEGLATRYPEVATWASDNPLKQHGAPLDLRARLLEKLVNTLAHPRVHWIQELSSPWTIETLARARRRWPQAELVLVIGSDLLEQIPRWRAADQLLPQVRLAVIPRRGWPLKEDALESLRRQGARVEVLPLALEASASSRIRELGATGPEAIALIPAAIRPVVRRLYGSREAPESP